MDIEYCNIALANVYLQKLTVTVVVCKVMRTRDKAKIIMASKSDSVANETASRKEVGAQDNPVVISEGESQPGASQNNTELMLDRLVQMVDGVAGKIGVLEQRLTQLEGDAGERAPVGGDILPPRTETDEPRFGEAGVYRAKPKVKKSRTTVSDFEIVESNVEGRTKKKKKAEKKAGHAIKVIPQEYMQKLSKCVDRTVVEKRAKPAESMTLMEAGLLTTQEIEELGNIGLGAQAQATQFWAVEQQAVADNQILQTDFQKDLLEFLKQEKPVQQQTEVKQVQWSNPPIANVIQKSPGRAQEKRADDNWKSDPRIQALIVKHMQELEADSRAESTQGKRKRSGRYNTTGNPVAVAFRHWPNGAILVGQSRRQVTFDELTQTQFLMGFIKNVNDTMDGS